MRTLILTIVLFALVPLSAHAQGAAQIEFYPLKVGHRWTYRATDIRQKSDQRREVVIQVDREEPYLQPVKKGEETVMEKRVGCLLKSTSVNKMTFDHVVVLEEGVHRIHSAGTKIDPPLKFIQRPLNVGDTWKCNSLSGNVTLKGTFTTKTDSIRVPLGIFDRALWIAYRGESQEARLEIDYWFVSGIGMVKQRVLAADHEIMLELEKFEPAK
jgi:hypothetical protein